MLNYKDVNFLKLVIAIDGKNMLLFNPGEIDALAEQMEKMISNDNLRQSIAPEST